MKSGLIFSLTGPAALWESRKSEKLAILHFCGNPTPTWQVAEDAERKGGSSQFAEVKAIQLALDTAEQEK